MSGRDEDCAVHVLNTVNTKTCRSCDPVVGIIQHPGLQMLQSESEELTSTTR